jgi:hypothetical protein
MEVSAFVFASEIGPGMKEPAQTGFSPWDRPSFLRHLCLSRGRHVPEAKASSLPLLNVRAKARTYLRSNNNDTEAKTTRNPS